MTRAYLSFRDAVRIARSLGCRVYVPRGKGRAGEVRFSYTLSCGRKMRHNAGNGKKTASPALCHWLEKVARLQGRANGPRGSAAFFSGRVAKVG